MPFKPGISGNPNGKPKGTKHDKSDEAIRDFLRSKGNDYLFGTGENCFDSDFNSLKPSMRIQVWEKYMKYYLSALQALKVDGDVNVNQNGVIKIDFGFGNKQIDNDMQDIIDLI